MVMPSEDATTGSSERHAAIKSAREALYQRQQSPDALEVYLQLAAGTQVYEAGVTDQAPRISTPLTRKRLKGGAAVLLIMAAVVGLAAIAGSQHPHQVIPPTATPHEVAVRTVPLTLAEQQTLGLLVRNEVGPASRVGARTQGDINQTADTAESVLGNGILGEAEQPVGTRQAFAVHRASAVMFTKDTSHLQIVLLAPAAMNVDCAVILKGRTSHLLQQHTASFRSSATALQYATLLVPTTGSSVEVSFLSGSKQPFFWSLSAY